MAEPQVSKRCSVVTLPGRKLDAKYAVQGPSAPTQGRSAYADAGSGAASVPGALVTGSSRHVSPPSGLTASELLPLQSDPT